MATTTTHSATCPMHEGGCGELVTARTSFEEPTVTFAACRSLIAQGWKGPQAVLWKSQAERYLPAATETIVRHADGLVSFRIPA